MLQLAPLSATSGHRIAKNELPSSLPRSCPTDGLEKSEKNGQRYA
jgi:hypothetical protein